MTLRELELLLVIDEAFMEMSWYGSSQMTTVLKSREFAILRAIEHDRLPEQPAFHGRVPTDGVGGRARSLRRSAGRGQL